LNKRQHRGLARVVGLTGQLDVHLEHVAVQLLYETDGLLGSQLQRLEDLGQYSLEGCEGFAFLYLLIAAVLLLVGLRVPTVVVASLVATIVVAAFPSAYTCSVSVTAR
jgi:hypothetical protein